jgi:hypothetical protein
VVAVGTWEAFVNIVIDALIGGPHENGTGVARTPEAQMGAFDATYSRFPALEEL